MVIKKKKERKQETPEEIRKANVKESGQRGGGIRDEGERLELATSRTRAAGLPDPALLGGQIVTQEDVKKNEARRIAERNVAVDRAESDVIKETGIEKELPEEEATEAVTTQTEKKGKQRFHDTTFTDETGRVHTSKFPISEKEFQTAQQTQLTQDIATLAIGAGGGRIGNLGGPVTNTIFKTIMTRRAIVGLGTAISGGDVIGTWYAADNVQSAIPFHLKEIRKGLADGTVTPEKAAELIAEAQDNFDKAGNFINKSTMLNPVLWPFRKLYMSGQDQKQAEIDIIVNSMTQQQEGNI